MTSNIALYAITMVVLVWSSLTVYLSYEVYTQLTDVSQDIQRFALACIIMGVLFVVIFTVYAYNRTQDASQKLVMGFKWYDAMILFILLGWCAMTIAIASIVLQYHQGESGRINESTRSVAIASIVIAIVVLLQFVTYLYVQEQIPIWCDEYAKVQEQQMERLKRLDPRLRASEDSSRRSQQPYSGQQIIVMPSGAELVSGQEKPSTIDRYL
jgi:hypothetical protein